MIHQPRIIELRNYLNTVIVGPFVAWRSYKQ